MPTMYLGPVTVASGYYGRTTTLHLCRDASGVVWGAWTGGYVTFADPARGIPPLPTL